MKGRVERISPVQGVAFDVARSFEDRRGFADHNGGQSFRQMLDKETGAPFTQHTTNPVLLILVNAQRLHKLRKGKLCDIAPTLLQLAGLSAPQEMTGESLILGE